MDKDDKVALTIILFVVLVGAGLVTMLIYDGCYRMPVAADRANIECQSRGFDFYSSYKRIGLFSKEPVAITCKYVENRQDINLDLKQSIGGE